MVYEIENIGRCYNVYWFSKRPAGGYTELFDRIFYVYLTAGYLGVDKETGEIYFEVVDSSD